jgi:hypothetical protein
LSVSKRILSVLPLLAALVAASAPAFAQPPMPPQEAVRACEGRSTGDACTLPNGMAGSCGRTPGGLACVPVGRAPGNQEGQEWAGRPNGVSPMRNASMSRSDGPGPGRRPPSYPADADSSPLAERRPIPTAGVPDTNQRLCFDETHPIACPAPGEPYYGQDAQYAGPQPAYRDNSDGTVTDLLTGLTWQQGHNAERLRYYDAKRSCESLVVGGRDDWRLPSVKELYSLITFDGAAGVKPYLDTRYFDIEPPDASFLKNDRFSTHFPDMMGQTWTSTLYAGQLWDRPEEAAFFVNFLDGRIKCGGTRHPVELFWRCVRGAPWGANDFADNGDGTVTDRAVGLTWQQSDDGKKRDWPEALAYCEELRLGGKDDWRLPNAKELEYIADYSRVPALAPPLRMSDPAGWFWTSTTHGDNVTQADYVCFGKCVSESGVDVHGAGAQRSDPKTMSQKHGSRQGGQEDEIRVRNYVRCVRD